MLYFLYDHNYVRSLKYCIVQIFDGENPWKLWQITGGSPNFAIQILTIYHDIAICDRILENRPRCHIFHCLYFSLFNTL